MDNPQVRRRTIYRFTVRSVPNPFMEALDCADPNLNTPVRSQTLTALQALALWNDLFMVRQSQEFAPPSRTDPRRSCRADRGGLSACARPRAQSPGARRPGGLRGQARTGACLPGDLEYKRVRLRRLNVAQLECKPVTMMTRQPIDGAASLDRRGFLWRTGGGFGAVALAHLLGSESLLADSATGKPLGPKPELNGGLHHLPGPSEWCSSSCRALPASATRLTTSPF